MFRTSTAAFLLAAAVASAAEQPLISTDELMRRWKADAPGHWPFLLFDARSRTEFEEGHIPGARSLPASQAAALISKFTQDKARELIVYCNGPDCTKSRKAAAALVEVGYQHVLVYDDGAPGWVKAGGSLDGKPLPAADSPEIQAEELNQWIKVAHPVLLDIRDADEFHHFHVSGSVNVPLDDLRARHAELDSRSPICIIDHAGHQTQIASRLLRSLGFERTRRLAGGITAWKKLNPRL